MSKIMSKIISQDFCSRCATRRAATRGMAYTGIINSNRCHNLCSWMYLAEREVVTGQDPGLDDFHRGAS